MYMLLHLKLVPKIGTYPTIYEVSKRKYCSILWGRYEIPCDFVLRQIQLELIFFCVLIKDLKKMIVGFLSVKMELIYNTIKA